MSGATTSTTSSSTFCLGSASRCISTCSGSTTTDLNNILMKIALDASITMLVTLDKSQANGPHEKALLDADRQHNLALFNTHFVTKTHVQEFAIGQSATHQISHTKGFVADGRVAGEGSTNWSASGEGTFVVKRKPRRSRLQGAEQHPVDHYRPGHDQPLLGRAGCRAYGRAKASRGGQSGRQQAFENQGRKAAIGRQGCRTASRAGSDTRRIEGEPQSAQARWLPARRASWRLDFGNILLIK